MMGRSLFKIPEADFHQDLPNESFHVFLRYPELQGAESDIFIHRRAKDLVIGILKQQSDIAPNLRSVRFGDRDPMDEYRGAALEAFRQDAVQMQEEGRFAGAVGSDQSHVFSFFNRQGNALKRPMVIRVLEIEIPDLNGCRHDFHPLADIAANIRSARSVERRNN